MKSKRIVILSCVLVVIMSLAVFFVACDKDNGKNTYSHAEAYVTTGTMSKLMSRQSTLGFEAYESTDDLETNGVVVSVDTESQKQQFYGYGATLTHSSAYLLTQEGAEATADEMLKEMYGTDGARFGLVRIPIGSSDYIEGNAFFTCDDLENENDTDYNLEHFSIAHDTNIIAVLKKIVALNPDVKILACPWSAPVWMKTNSSLKGGELDVTCYDVYAEYLAKFVEAYKEEGINISYVSLVNEPMVTGMAYPYMYVSAETAIDLSDRLAEKFDDKGLDVKILGWEHNVDYSAFMYEDMVFDSEDGTKNMDGIAYHGYGDVDNYTVSEGCDYIQENYSGKEIFMTEITEHTGSNDFASNLSYAGRYVTIDPLNYGLNGAMFWNLVLRQNGTPTAVSHTGNECYGVLDMDYADGEYSYFKRSAYYAMAHVGKFAYPINGVYPTVLSVESSNEYQIVACALKRADGVIVVCAVNVSDQLPENVYLAIDGKSVMIELQPQSIVTFVVNPDGTIDSSESYTSQGISHVDIVQKSTNTFQYSVTSDIAPSATSRVYVSRYNSVTSDMTPVEYEAVDGKYVFTEEVKYKEYFIHIVDGTKSAVLPLTRPQMAPSLSIIENGSAVLTYNFVNGTSWSSFCDPTGKAVYRSSKLVYDESATIVEKNVNIAGVDSTTDVNPSDSEPYYYVVLSAKNGIVTYVSAPLMTVERAYSDIAVSLKLESGTPYLQIDGKFVVDGDIAPELYSADTKLGKVLEIVGNSKSGKAGESFSVKLDISQVVSGASGAGIWYDIKLRSSSGSLYEVDDSVADFAQTVLYGNVTFEFKEWNHILKLNYQYYDFTATSVTIDTTGVPTLIVKGVYADGMVDVKLHADYDDKQGDKHHLYWDNKSTKDGEFEFRVELTDIPATEQPWAWFHIYTYTNANTHNEGNLIRGNQLAIGQEFEYNGIRYAIKAHEGVGSQLVIEAMLIQD